MGSFSAVWGGGEDALGGDGPAAAGCGSEPDDNESLYHSFEAPDSECTRVLVERGARIGGTNSVARALDYGKLEDLRMMLERDPGAAAERPVLYHAVMRGRSMEFIRLLADAGADLQARPEGGASVYRLAACFGRTDVMEFLRERGAEEPLHPMEQFAAACARNDETAARALLAAMPDIFARMPEGILRVLPELAGLGRHDAVRLMLELGWPREVKSAWDATALNLAVYQGDARMAAVLLDYGADWRTPHGYKDNVVGTLSHSSRNPPENPDGPRDFVGCARVLLEHGVPVPGEEYCFSAEVEAVFDEARLAAGRV